MATALQLRQAITACKMINTLATDASGFAGSVWMALELAVPSPQFFPQVGHSRVGWVGRRDDGLIVVVIAGFQGYGDWIGTMRHVKAVGRLGGITVANTLAQEALAFWTEIEAAGFGNAPNGYLLIGHSAGGAAAAILAAFFKEQGYAPAIDVVTIGRPDCMSQAGEDFITDRCVNFAGNDDIITALIPPYEIVTRFVASALFRVATYIPFLGGKLYGAGLSPFISIARPERVWFGDNGITGAPSTLTLFWLGLLNLDTGLPEPEDRDFFLGHESYVYQRRLESLLLATTQEEANMWPASPVGSVITGACAWYGTYPPPGTTAGMWVAMAGAIGGSSSPSEFITAYQTLLSAGTVNPSCGAALAQTIGAAFSLSGVDAGNSSTIIVPTSGPTNTSGPAPWNFQNVPLTSQNLATGAGLIYGLVGVPNFVSPAARAAWRNALKEYETIGGNPPIAPPPVRVMEGVLAVPVGASQPGLPVGYPTFVPPSGGVYAARTSLDPGYKAKCHKIGAGQYGVWWGVSYVMICNHRKTGRRLARGINNLLADLGLSHALDISAFVSMWQYAIVQNAWPFSLFNDTANDMDIT